MQRTLEQDIEQNTNDERSDHEQELRSGPAEEREQTRELYGFGDQSQRE